MLDKEQKEKIIRSRISIVEGVLYNIDLEIESEQVKSSPNMDFIEILVYQRNEETLSLAMLNEKLAKVLSNEE